MSDEEAEEASGSVLFLGDVVRDDDGDDDEDVDEDEDDYADYHDNIEYVCPDHFVFHCVSSAEAWAQFGLASIFRWEEANHSGANFTDA